MSVNVKNKNEYSFKTGCLNITIEDVDNKNPNISITNAVPVSDIEGIENKGYKFRIRNTCKTKENYKISLESIENIKNKIEDQYIRASLKSEGTFDYIIKTLKEGETELYTGTLKENEIKEFELKEWVEYNATNEQVGNKSYQNKIKVEVNPEIKPKESDIRIEIEDNKATITTKETNNLQYCIGRTNKCNNYNPLENNEISLEDEGKKIICVKGVNQDICNIGGNYYGEGTIDNPYQIQYIDDLVTLSNKTNYGTSYEAEYFKLTRDLDFQNINDYKTRDETLKTSLTTGNGFTPIGNEGNHFKGNFEGNNNKLSNIYINNTIEYNAVGLFGYIENGSVKDLTISGEVKTTVVADIGALTGRLNNSTIENIYNYTSVMDKGTVTAIGGIVGATFNKVNLIKCVNAGTVTNGIATGGLIGAVAHLSETLIDNCYNIASISRSNISDLTFGIGGLIGGVIPEAESITIKNSHNSGNVYNNQISYSSTGGLIGNSSASTFIENCYNTGEIKNEKLEYDTYYDQDVGGLIGSFATDGEYIIIRNSYNTGNVLNGNYTGGIVGYNYHSNLIIDRCYNTGEINSSIKYKNSEYWAIMGGIIGHNLLNTNVKSYVINSYNTGNIINGNELVSNNYAGGIQGAANVDVNIINSYNTGKIERTGNTGNYAAYGGIFGVSEEENSKLTINNVYNLGEVINNKQITISPTLIRSIGSINTDVNINKYISNIYFKEGLEGTNINIGTPMKEEDMKSVKLVNQLNDNLESIDLTSINNELKTNGVIKEGEEITLSTWYLSNDGYPTLNNN